eukprot:EG_transcript_8921
MAPHDGYSPDDTAVKDRLFKGPTYRDGWVAVVFLLHLGLLGGGATYTVSSGRAFRSETWFPWARDAEDTPRLTHVDPSPECLHWAKEQTVAAAVTAGVVVAAGLTLATFWLGLATHRPLGLLRTLLAGYAGLSLMALVMQVVAFGFSAMSLLTLLLLPLYFLWWRLLWHRAEFSAAIMQKACRTVTEHKMTLGVAFFMVLVSVVYKIAWVLTLNLTTASWQLLPLLLCVMWSDLVFINLTHTTTCGVAATDFFIPEGVASPVWGAFRRSCTYSLGSVCLGSAVVAVLRFIRFVALSLRQSAAERRNAALLLVACCVECLFGWLEALVQYFNHYAFVQVAMYGKPFTQAARDTWTLVQTSGVDAVLNDMIIHTATGMCTALSALAVGLSASFASYLISMRWWSHCENYTDGVVPYTVVAGLMAAVVCAVLHGIVFTVLDSAIVTFFVCFVEEPEVLALKHPELDMEITRRLNSLRNV